MLTKVDEERYKRLKTIEGAHSIYIQFRPDINQFRQFAVLLRHKIDNFVQVRTYANVEDLMEGIANRYKDDWEFMWAFDLDSPDYLKSLDVTVVIRVGNACMNIGV